MKVRVLVLLAALMVSPLLGGCSGGDATGTVDAPSTADPQAEWPDEVKQAEADFARKGAENAAKAVGKAPR